MTFVVVNVTCLITCVSSIQAMTGIDFADLANVSPLVYLLVNVFSGM